MTGQRGSLRGLHQFDLYRRLLCQQDAIEQEISTAGTVGEVWRLGAQLDELRAQIDVVRAACRPI